MREIKFSYVQQHKETGRFVDVRATLENIERMTAGVTFKGYALVARRQFTGLLDQNGKEVYEGDVIRGEADGEVSADVWLVDFVEGEFCAKNDRDQIGLHYWAACHIEVIGNIYENPEMVQP